MNMGLLKGMTHSAALRLDNRRHHLRYHWRGRFGWPETIHVHFYRGYASSTGDFRIGGRVLASGPIDTPEEGVGWWTNTRHMVRRFTSREVFGARLRMTLGDLVEEIQADKDGYFWWEGASTQLAESQETWMPVSAELLSPISPQSERVFEGNVQVSRTRLGVVSDVDDTIIVSGATNAFSLIKTTLMHDATRRRVFDGLADFYNNLHPKGEPAQTNIPFWYLSSSAWNMYDYFEAVWRTNRLPWGSFILRDLGVTEEHLFKGSHEAHKLGALRNILETCPHTNFILIGDTGQRDPFIYAQIAREHPERIEAIYLRDVTHGERSELLDALAEELSPQVPFIYSPTLDDCILHAVRQGWLDAIHGEQILGNLASALQEENDSNLKQWIMRDDTPHRVRKRAAFATLGVAAGLAIWGVRRAIKQRS